MRQVIAGEATVQFRKGTFDQIGLIICNAYSASINLTDPILTRSLLHQSALTHHAAVE
ncbi:hypothetical protein D3C81_2279590 [compost metagenome]